MLVNLSVTRLVVLMSVELLGRLAVRSVSLVLVVTSDGREILRHDERLVTHGEREGGESTVLGEEVRVEFLEGNEVGHVLSNQLVGKSIDRLVGLLSLVLVVVLVLEVLQVDLLGGQVVGVFVTFEDLELFSEIRVLLELTDELFSFLLVVKIDGSELGFGGFGGILDEVFDGGNAQLNGLNLSSTETLDGIGDIFNGDVLLQVLQEDVVLVDDLGV